MTNQTRTEPLDRLAELEQAATPGPWHWNSYSTIFSEPATQHDEDADPVAYLPTRAGDLATLQGATDAAFIAALRNAAPSLIAGAHEAARLRTAGQHMYGVLSRMTVIDQRAPIGNFISAINQALDEGAVFVREDAALVKP